jgi:hypothetical protein
MAGCERTWPDRRLLDAVARIAGVGCVQVMDEVLPGESNSAFVVAAGDDRLVGKLVPGGPNALGNQRRLVRLVSGLRRRGYPAPEYIGAGESGGTIFTLQRRLPGQGLHRPGLPPEPVLFAAVLPDLLAAIELQRDAGDLARPPWPTWLVDTIQAGGDGYCLHATMRQADDTAALLGRLQALARRSLALRRAHLGLRLMRGGESMTALSGMHADLSVRHRQGRLCGRQLVMTADTE